MLYVILPWMQIRVLGGQNWEFLKMIKLRCLNTTIRTSMLGRRECHPRAQFMSPHVLFAIFCKGPFWNGVKTVANVLIFSGKLNNEEDNCVAQCEWLVWIQRAFLFLFLTLTTILFYIIYFLYYIQLTHAAPLVKAYRQWSLGPGFESQVPPFHFYYFV